MMRYLRLVRRPAAHQRRAGDGLSRELHHRGRACRSRGSALALLPLIVLFDERDDGRRLGSRRRALIVMAYFMAVQRGHRGRGQPVARRSRRADPLRRVRLRAAQAGRRAVRWSRRRGYEPWKMFDLLGAIGLAIYAFCAARLRHRRRADVALGIVLFVAGVLAMYSLWILCAAASFWVVRLDNLIYLLGAIFDTARWPVQVFRGAWRFVFTFVIPVAVMTTFPAMALLGRLDARTALATIGGALAMLAGQPADLARGDPQLHERVELAGRAQSVSRNAIRSATCWSSASRSRPCRGPRRDRAAAPRASPRCRRDSTARSPRGR